MIAIKKMSLSRAAAIGIMLLGVLPGALIPFAVDNEYGLYAGMSWMVLTVFAYAGVCFRTGLLERTHRDYLLFRLVLLFGAMFVISYYYIIIMLSL